MGKSFKKTPIAGIATAASEKAWKEKVNRKLRKKVKQALNTIEDNWEEKELPELREVSVSWDAPKDGKRYYKVGRYWDEETIEEKILRK